MNRKTLLAIVILVLAAALGFAVYNMNTDGALDNGDATIQQEQEQTHDQAEGEIEVSEDGRVVTYSGRDGETALAVLRSLTTVETEDSDFGEFVVAINEIRAGEGEFWAFYVNGEPANEGAGTFVTSDDDEIEWRLEESA